MDITELLGFSVKQGASDLHITAGMPPLIRVDGDIRRINVPEMDQKEVHSLVYEIMNDKQRKDFEEFLILDGELTDPDNKVFKKGDFVTFEPGSTHSSYSKNGCLILVFMRSLNKAIK